MLLAVTAGEAQILSHRLPVERKAAARQRARAEWQHIGARARFAEPLPIAREHFEIGQQIMRPKHGLRAPHVRVSWDHSVGILRREIEQRSHYATQQSAHRGRILRAATETRIERHLLIAAAAGVDLIGHRGRHALSACGSPALCTSSSVAPS